MFDLLSEGNMKVFEYTVKNEEGLNMAAAGAIRNQWRKNCPFSSVTFVYEGKEVFINDAVDVSMLGALKGSSIKVIVDDDDSDEAIEDIKSILDKYM